MALVERHSCVTPRLRHLHLATAPPACCDRRVSTAHWRAGIGRTGMEAIWTGMAEGGGVTIVRFSLSGGWDPGSGRVRAGFLVAYRSCALGLLVAVPLRLLMS